MDLPQKRPFKRPCDVFTYTSLPYGCDSILTAGSLVLPADTRFFCEPVPVFATGPFPGYAEQLRRWALRMAWHDKARALVQTCDLVFTDPDKGILYDDRKTQKPSHEHSYWDELDSYLADGKSLVAYHHLGRQPGGHEQQAQGCLRRIRERGYKAWAVHYRRGTSRLFLIIPARDEHRLVLWERTQRFVASRWQEHAHFLTA